MASNNDKRNESELDALITKALKAQTSELLSGKEDDALRLARLERQWSVGLAAQSEVQPLNAETPRRWKLALAVAASVLIAGMSLWTGRDRGDESSQPLDLAGREHADPDRANSDRARISVPAELVQNRRPREIRDSHMQPPDDKPAVAITQQTMPQPIAPKRATARSQQTIGREPTATERLFFMANSRQRERLQQRSLDDALDRLLSEGRTQLKWFTRAEVEAALVDRFTNADTTSQRRLLPWLTKFGAETTIDLLVARVQVVAGQQTDSLSEQLVWRNELLLALERIAGVRRWPELSERFQEKQLRRAISQRLVQLLDHEQLALRQAASEAIGRSFDCEVTEELIARVMRQPSGNEETWFALFACSCPSANAFLAQAQHNPHMLGQFNNARLRWLRGE